MSINENKSNRGTNILLAIIAIIVFLFALRWEVSQTAVNDGYEDICAEYNC